MLTITRLSGGLRPSCYWGGGPSLHCGSHLTGKIGPRGLQSHDSPKILDMIQYPLGSIICNILPLKFKQYLTLNQTPFAPCQGLVLWPDLVSQPEPLFAEMGQACQTSPDPMFVVLLRLEMLTVHNKENPHNSPLTFSCVRERWGLGVRLRLGYTYH